MSELRGEVTMIADGTPMPAADPAAASMVDALRQRIESLERESKAHTPWYRQATTLLSGTALIVSLLTFSANYRWQWATRVDSSLQQYFDLSADYQRLEVTVSDPVTRAYMQNSMANKFFTLAGQVETLVAGMNGAFLSCESILGVGNLLLDANKGDAADRYLTRAVHKCDGAYRAAAMKDLARVRMANGRDSDETEQMFADAVALLPASALAQKAYFYEAWGVAEAQAGRVPLATAKLAAALDLYRDVRPPRPDAAAAAARVSKLMETLSEGGPADLARVP